MFSAVFATLLVANAVFVEPHDARRTLNRSDVGRVRPPALVTFASRSHARIRDARSVRDQEANHEVLPFTRPGSRRACPAPALVPPGSTTGSDAPARPGTRPRPAVGADQRVGRSHPSFAAPLRNGAPRRALSTRGTRLNVRRTAVVPRSTVPAVPPAHEERSAFNAKALVAFFALTYALSWGWVIPLALTGNTVLQGRGWPTHFPSLLGPMVAAFAVTAWTMHGRGIHDLLAGWCGGASDGDGGSPR